MITDRFASIPYTSQLSRASRVQLLRRHGTRKRSLATPLAEAFDAIPRPASRTSRSEVAPQARGEPSWPAIGSRVMVDVLGLGRIGLELWQNFSVFQTFVDNAKGQHSNGVPRLISGRAVADHAGQIDCFGNPPPVDLAVNFEAQDQLLGPRTTTPINLQQLHRTRLVAFYYGALMHLGNSVQRPL